MDISNILTIIRPGSQWTLNGETYSGLEWFGPGEKPTLAELEAAWDSRPAAPVVVSMTSLRLALIDAGLYHAITSAINSIADVTERLKAQTWWTTAQTVREDHPLVAAIATMAGQTDVQVRAIFTVAQTLDHQSNL